MPLSVTVEEVKRKCMIASSDASHDSEIAALISEMLPAVEYSIDPDYLSDTQNTQLQSLLKLGALETIAAEFMSQLSRQPGYGEDIQVGGVRIGPFWERGKALGEQAQARLAPYLRRGPGQTERILSSSLQLELQFSDEEMSRW